MSAAAETSGTGDHEAPAHGSGRLAQVGTQLRETLIELIDLAVIGKALHWGVVDPHFWSVRLRLEQLVDAWRELSDEHPVGRDLAERLADVPERIRERMDRLGELDAVTEDVLIRIVGTLGEQLRTVPSHPSN